MEKERWSLSHEGRLHEVFVARGLRVTRVQWHVDGHEVASVRDIDDKIVLTPADFVGDNGPAQPPGPALAGAVGVRSPTLFGGTRRVVLHPGGLEHAQPESGAEPDEDEGTPDSPDLSLLLSFDRGTVDLVPDPGTPGARRQEWIIRHPRLHVAREALGAGGGVLFGLFLVTVVIPLLGRFLPDFSIPLPDVDLPSLPRPDLPTIPWPDLPDVPRPDLPDWFGTALKLVIAVAVAWGIARGEVKRRRHDIADTPQQTDAPRGADAPQRADDRHQPDRTHQD